MSGAMVILNALSYLEEGDPKAEPLREAFRKISPQSQVILVDVVLKTLLANSATADPFLRETILLTIQKAIDGARRFLPEEPITRELEKLLP